MFNEADYAHNIVVQLTDDDIRQAILNLVPNATFIRGVVAEDLNIRGNGISEPVSCNSGNRQTLKDILVALYAKDLNVTIGYGDSMRTVSDFCPVKLTWALN